MRDCASFVSREYAGPISNAATPARETINRRTRSQAGPDENAAKRTQTLVQRPRYNNCAFVKGWQGLGTPEYRTMVSSLMIVRELRPHSQLSSFETYSQLHRIIASSTFKSSETRSKSRRRLQRRLRRCSTARRSIVGIVPHMRVGSLGVVVGKYGTVGVKT